MMREASTLMSGQEDQEDSPDPAETPETRTVWTSKHALTRGIERFDNAEEVWPGHHRALRVVDRHGKRKLLHPGEWHLTEADAVRKANEMRARAIDTHRRSIAKLEGLRFGARR
jgi:hypothetical protein